MALNSKDIGRRIRHFRSEKNLSQEELGNIIFSTREHIGRIETGEKLPGLETIVLIANALGTTANDLLADNLDTLESEAEKVSYKAFSDCNSIEKAILLKNLESLKSLLREFNI